MTVNDYEKSASCNDVSTRNSPNTPPFWRLPSQSPVRHVSAKITVGWVQVRVFCCRKTEQIYLLLSGIVIDRVII